MAPLVALLGWEGVQVGHLEASGTRIDLVLGPEGWGVLEADPWVHLALRAEEAASASVGLLAQAAGLALVPTREGDVTGRNICCSKQD